MKKESASIISGYFEPELIHTFLPGCRNCGGSHPLARSPKQPKDKCPDCGAIAGKMGESHVEKAVLIGSSPSTIVAKVFLGLGKALNKLSKRI